MGGRYLAHFLGGTTVTASFTADAVLKTTTSASFTANAVIRVTQSASFTADAEIIDSAFIRADAIILATQAASFTANAVVKATIAASFTANAFVQPYFRADAYVADRGFTADADIFFERTEATFTADALIFTLVWEDDFNRADEPMSARYLFVSGDVDNTYVIDNEMAQEPDRGFNNLWDTFTRSVGSGWGTASNGLGTWLTQGGTTLSVDGDEGVSTGSDAMYQAINLGAVYVESPELFPYIEFLPSTSGDETSGLELAQQSGSEFIRVEVEIVGSTTTLHLNTTNISQNIDITADFDRSVYNYIYVEAYRDTGLVQVDVVGTGVNGFQISYTDPDLVGVVFDKFAIHRDAAGATTGKWTYAEVGYAPFQFAEQTTWFGWHQPAGYAIIQFDFKTAANPDLEAWIDFNMAAGLSPDDGRWYWPRIFVAPSIPATEWDFFTDWAVLTGVPLDEDTWYTVKAMGGTFGVPDRIKVWKRGDPEPDWMVEEQSEGYVDEPSTLGYTGEFGSFETEPLYLDNWLFTALEPGFFHASDSITANAIIKKTTAYDTFSELVPAVVASASALGSSGSASASFTGLSLDDFLVAVGVVSGFIPESQIGGVRGTLGGPTFTRQAYLTSNTTTYGVWFTSVRPMIGGGVPSTYVWEWSAGTSTRILFLAKVTNSRKIVNNSVRYGADLVAGTTVTIPAGTGEILLNGSLALPTFGTTSSSITSFSPPINATELADRVLSVLKAAINQTQGVAQGDNPEWTATLNGGGTSLSQGIYVEVPPSAPLLANAVIKGLGNNFLANAIITTPMSLIWEDLFNDRFATNGWGGVWQSIPGEESGVSADGAQGTVTNTGTGQRRLTGYPVIGVGRYTFDFIFEQRSTFTEITVESIATSGYGMLVLFNSFHGVTVGGSNQSFTFALNQWYSADINNFGSTTTVSWWRRDTPEVSTSLTGTNVAAPSFVPRWWVKSTTTTTRVDNVRAYTGAGWKRFYTFIANAIVKKTQTTKPPPLAHIPLAFSSDAVLNRGGRIPFDAYLRNAPITASVLANAVIVLHHTFEAHAVLIEDTRARHARDGHEHTGVDHAIHHTLAATIEGYLAGENLHDVLVDIDARLSELEAQ